MGGAWLQGGHPVSWLVELLSHSVNIVTHDGGACRIS
jgi:hypothetical protein